MLRVHLGFHAQAFSPAHALADIGAEPVAELGLGDVVLSDEPAVPLPMAAPSAQKCARGGSEPIPRAGSSAATTAARARRPIARYAYQKHGIRGAVVSFFGWVDASLVERRIWRIYEADWEIRVQDNRRADSTIIKVDSIGDYITQGYI